MTVQVAEKLIYYSTT